MMSGGGRIVIVKRNGSTGSSYPLDSGTLSVGSDKRCDIRVLVGGFPRRLCSISVKGDRAFVENLAVSTPTKVNDVRLTSRRALNHGDEISINENKFRWEYKCERQVAVVRPLTNRGYGTPSAPAVCTRGVKLVNPILDKHKRAALMLMTGRSPVNRTVSKSVPNTASKIDVSGASEASNSKAVRFRTGPPTRSGGISKIPLRSRGNNSFAALSNKKNTSPSVPLKNAILSGAAETARSKRQTVTSKSDASVSGGDLFDISGIEAIPDVEPHDVSRQGSTRVSRHTDTDDDPARPKNEGNSLLMSFISQLTDALHTVNDPDSVMAVLRTPEFRALNEQMKSAGKRLDVSGLESTSPRILEIGALRKRPPDNLNSSPIISPKRRVRNGPSPDDSLGNINSTPNLSKLFAVESSTPLEKKSVRKRVGELESLEVDRRPSPRKSTRSGTIAESILEKKSLFEVEGSRSEPRKGLRRVTKVTRKTLAVANTESESPKKAKKAKTADVASDASDATDVNAPKPENEIVITPKSTTKPAQEVLKEKHSTAKKPVSRKTMIDHLTRSPEIVKELFKSPVKRKLSHSIRQYDSNETFRDARDVNLLNSIVNTSVSRTLKRSPKASVSFGLNASETSFKATNENKSLRSDNRKTKTKTLRSPKNDLSDFRGIKKLLKTPKSFTSKRDNSSIIRGIKKNFASSPDARLFDRKSPKNDLTNLTGVKRLLRTPFKSSNAHKNNSLEGVKQLFDAKSPKNDLTDVAGVRRLLRTPSKASKTPKNDPSHFKGVKQLFAEPKQSRINQNDSSVLGAAAELFSTPPKRSSKNDTKKSPGRPPINKNNSVSRSETLFDAVVGRTPQKTYSSIKPRTSSPKSTSPTDVEVSRSRRQVTIDRTNFSMEVSKTFSNKKPKTDSEISILGQSTPAPAKKILNETNISFKQLSPILASEKASKVTKVSTHLKRASKVVKSKKLSVEKISPAPRKTTRSQKTVEVKSAAKEVKLAVSGNRVKKAAKEQNPPKKVTVNTETRRPGRSKKNVVVEEPSVQMSSLKNDSNKKEKKKVHFASDVKLKSADDNTDKSRARRALKRNAEPPKVQVPESASKSAKAKAVTKKPAPEKTNKGSTAAKVVKPIKKAKETVTGVIEKGTRSTRGKKSGEPIPKPQNSKTKAKKVETAVVEKSTKPTRGKVVEKEKATAKKSNITTTSNSKKGTKSKTVSKTVTPTVSATRGRKRKSEEINVNAAKKPKVTRSNSASEKSEKASKSKIVAVKTKKKEPTPTKKTTRQRK